MASLGANPGVRAAIKFKIGVFNGNEGNKGAWTMERTNAEGLGRGARAVPKRNGATERRRANDGERFVPSFHRRRIPAEGSVFCVIGVRAKIRPGK